MQSYALTSFEKKESELAKRRQLSAIIVSETTRQSGVNGSRIPVEGLSLIHI